MQRRLAAANVEPGTPPVGAWRRLREIEGPTATVIDLYELVATPRGLAPHELPQQERARLARSVMPDVWPGFAQTDASERRGDTIRIVDYDPDWPRQYERWRAVLQSCLGDTALRIEHVGSTAVPGLAAKPVVDIQVSVSDLNDESLYVSQLECAGVQLRSRDDLHRYFRPYPGQPRDVHIHVCATGSEWEREHLPGCFTRGSILEECQERAVEAIWVHIAGLRADGEPVPQEVGAPQLLAVTVAA
jgi:predicted RNase H-like HicB family nuclease